jgi:hypothetical protein
MNVMYRTVLEVVVMNNKEFNQELAYQIIMIQETKLLNDGVIEKEQYEDFQRKTLEMYQPILSKYMDETLDK